MMSKELFDKDGHATEEWLKLADTSLLVLAERIKAAYMEGINIPNPSIADTLWNNSEAKRAYAVIMSLAEAAPVKVVGRYLGDGAWEAHDFSDIANGKHHVNTLIWPPRAVSYVGLGFWMYSDGKVRDIEDWTKEFNPDGKSHAHAISAQQPGAHAQTISCPDCNGSGIELRQKPVRHGVHCITCGGKGQI